MCLHWCWCSGASSPVCSFNCCRRRRCRSHYDVFLNFRGLDVRRGFVSHLYDALTSAGFSVFLDSHQMKRGDDISAALHHAIQVSHILIPIFSRSYAQSAWCLKEASHIANRLLDGSAAIVIPLFYDVSPSQGRHPDIESNGSPFAEEFQEHENGGRYGPQEIDEWKAALCKISSRSGWSLQEDSNGLVTHFLFVYMLLLLLVLIVIKPSFILTSSADTRQRSLSASSKTLVNFVRDGSLAFDFVSSEIFLST